MIIIFGISLTVVLYCYIGYPALLTVVSWLKARPVQKSDLEPSVSIIIAAWNEQDVIHGRLVNLLEQDYPAEKIEVLVGSDASDDGTNKTLESINDPRLRSFFFQERRGKMAVLNDLVAQARHEVLLFADARQLFDQQAIKQLVQNFSDPQVGCVSGELVFQDPGSGAAKAVGLYWKYEKALRRLESRLHSMLGATGAIYAMRRACYHPIPEDLVLDDMYAPLQVIKSGYRAVFDNEALAFDSAAECPQEEFSRKARTLFGNYQLFFRMPEMFVPFVSPIAWQLFSHKFLRLLIPFFLVVLLGTNALLLSRPGFTFFLIMQVLFYLFAIYGCLAKERRYAKVNPLMKLAGVAYMFCVLNFAAVVGLFRFLFWGQRTTWDKAREMSVERRSLR